MNYMIMGENILNKQTLYGNVAIILEYIVYIVHFNIFWARNVIAMRFALVIDFRAHPSALPSRCFPCEGKGQEGQRRLQRADQSEEDRSSAGSSPKPRGR